MKNLIWRLSAVAAFAGLTWFGAATSAFAAEERGNPGDRLERLERQVRELAERQEQMMQRVTAQMERRAAMGGPGNQDFRPPMAQPGGENLRPPMAAPGVPAGIAPRAEAARQAKGLHDLLGLLFLIGVICNILLTIWIYTDIRKRNEGSGIFVAMALIAGIPAALIYALTRLVEKKTQA